MTIFINILRAMSIMEYPELTLLVAVVMLIASAAVLGGVTSTGNILQGQNCGALGCLKMCDVDSDCGQGSQCCPSSWGTGLCDKPESCNTIAIFTRTHQADATDPANILQNPDAQINNSAIAVLIIMIAISAVFIILWFVYRVPEQRMRRVSKNL